MLVRLDIENFKRIDNASIELGKNVVFVGPNNAGKTSALQAISLWYVGLVQWVTQKSDGASGRQRYGVTLNRKDLFALPVPHANLLWKDLHTRIGSRNAEGKTKTDSILIKITATGVLHDKKWSIPLEFDYANSESLFCRPSGISLTDERIQELKAVASSLKVAYLPPMSGLEREEALQQHGRINVLVGQGRTGEVLRNVCYSVASSDPDIWKLIAGEIQRLFGVALQFPQFDPTTGSLTLSYRAGKVELDISSAGRGLQQTLLLLTYLYMYPGSTILLDEPDAHLEVLRQRQTYDLITSVAANTGSQVIAATHSEQVLNIAAGRDTVIAFIGRPHRLNDQGAQLKKALSSIGYEHYMQAETKRWVLYLEGSTDLKILEVLARRLNHPIAPHLSGAYTDFLDTNVPPLAQQKFHALREAVPDLKGIALFDRLERDLPKDDFLAMVSWSRREIENYICTRRALIAWAEGIEKADDLFEEAERPRRREAMLTAIRELSDALHKLGRPDPFGPNLKVSEEFLEPLFSRYHEIMGLPESLMRKKQYYELAEFLPEDEIDQEIIEKLDFIWTSVENLLKKA